VFLGCGILSTPPSYHIELRFEKKNELLLVASLLREFPIKHLAKNNILYITGRENVKAFLYEIGATNTYLLMEEDAVNKKMTNEANRKANFEFANLKRQSNASTRQIEILKKMENDDSINNLSDELREVAFLRLRYPYSSLRELSEKTNGRLSKQTIYYRLKKIIKAYEK
jgi:DNA-binding protein WhiA